MFDSFFRRLRGRTLRRAVENQEPDTVREPTIPNEEVTSVGLLMDNILGDEDGPHVEFADKWCKQIVVTPFFVPPILIWEGQDNNENPTSQ